jgi:4a-hydroxytetrahydrobiopterin dehydratase
MSDAAGLAQKHCIPCEGGVDPLRGEKLQYYLPAVPEWTLVDERMLERDFSFKDFKEALAFVNKVGALAEQEQHHPDIFLHNWRKVKITLTTHKIKGLFDNDFVMAVKINNLFLNGKTTG